MGEIVKVNAGELKSFDDKKFAPNVVYQSAGIKVVLAYFKTGQFIPVHTPGVDLVLYILEGEAPGMNV
jgi:quercetin dioxygenase-like cupin family protein